MFLQKSGKITDQLELGRLRQFELLHVLKEALENCFFWIVTIMTVMEKLNPPPVGASVNSLLRDLV